MPFNNRRIRSERLIFFPFIAAAMALIFGAVVMFLWNAILPELLNVRPIGYWQSVGLLVLCRILFGNFRRGGPGGPGFKGGPAWREKWMRMTDEERRKFREDWKEKCRQKNSNS